MNFILQYWVEFAFGIISATLLAGYRGLRKDIQTKIVEQNAIKEGVVSLLRQSLVDSYNKWIERGYCPIYAKEVCEKVYDNYSALGGNDVGTELYERITKLPTEPPKESHLKEV